jgi:hypothetical protein
MPRLCTMKKVQFYNYKRMTLCVFADIINLIPRRRLHGLNYGWARDVATLKFASTRRRHTVLFNKRTYPRMPCMTLFRFSICEAIPAGLCCDADLPLPLLEPCTQKNCVFKFNPLALRQRKKHTNSVTILNTQVHKLFPISFFRRL